MTADPGFYPWADPARFLPLQAVHDQRTVLHAEQFRRAQDHHVYRDHAAGERALPRHGTTLHQQPQHQGVLHRGHRQSQQGKDSAVLGGVAVYPYLWSGIWCSVAWSSVVPCGVVQRCAV